MTEQSEILLLFGVLALVGLALLIVVLRAWRSRRRRARTAARRKAALARKFNPYISGEPVRKANMFYGREALLRQIFNALHHNSIMIYGERRIGKTTLLYQLAERLRRMEDPDWAFVPVYIDLEGTAEPVFFHLLMEHIHAAAQGVLADPFAPNSNITPSPRRAIPTGPSWPICGSCWTASSAPPRRSRCV